jgi:hypothetical protein
MTMEKQGVVNEQNTRPETPGEKDLTQHPTKRAEAKIDKLSVPNVRLSKEELERFKVQNDKLLG